MTQQQDRVAIVTGGARGIGAATARRLAGDGLSVAVLDLDEATASATAKEIASGVGSRVTGVGADVSDPAAVASAVEQVTADLGAPTVLVNNAGITRDNLLFRMSDDDWDGVLAVHLRGAFLMTRACQKHMVDAGWGRIVTMSSVSALGNRGEVNYATAKAGLQGLTRTLALELGPFGVTANCVAPGFVQSEMTRATAARLGHDWETYVAACAAEIPVRRAGTPEDIAATVAFFVRDDAGYVTGQTLYVAGGPRSG